MAILDAFKKRRKIKEKKKEVKPKEQPVKKTLTSKSEVKKRVFRKGEARLPAPRAQASGGQAYRILKAPHITEKATSLAEKNQYVFKVFPRANKPEVKKAVESLYKVDVISVRIVKIPKKRIRLGRITGWKKGFKKAIVKIKKGQKIETMPK